MTSARNEDQGRENENEVSFKFEILHSLRIGIDPRSYNVGKVGGVTVLPLMGLTLGNYGKR